MDYFLTMGMILKPSYNNNDRNNSSDTIESGTCPCNNGNCFYCHHMVKTRYIQFTKNGRKFYINGSFNCKTKLCVYAIKAPITNLYYIGSTNDFRKRKNTAKSNLKKYDPANGINNGCALVTH